LKKYFNHSKQGFFGFGETLAKVSRLARSGYSFSKNVPVAAIAAILWLTALTAQAANYWKDPVVHFAQANNGVTPTIGVQVVPVPEPSSVMLCAIALIMLLLLQSFRRWMQRNR
jgi:uncharacterized membrane protein YdfJ with MMPL/SSD domain